LPIPGTVDSNIVLLYPEVHMSVDSNAVRRIARLARIALDDGQAVAMEKELNSLLAWVEQLSEVDVEGVPPMTSVVEQKLKMRADVVNDGGRAADVLRNAPLSEEGFFVVPKVVE
jgi:aspartyl-tRNA(Asn)/glutamyl-tRNA(Gln) amidotransferase subunit C